MSMITLGKRNNVNAIPEVSAIKFTSELANQRVRKAPFTRVVHSNTDLPVRIVGLEIVARRGDGIVICILQSPIG